MTLTRHMKSFALVIFFLVLHCNLSFSRHHGIRHSRHKRNHGAHLYLTGSSIIPGGDGGPNDRWGEWGAPSECSRSCGGGVAYQTRECHNVDSEGRSKCRGGNKKYFSCNTQDCPDDEIDFRQQQCSHFDHQPFEGLRYEWVPYTKAPNPCELNCMPRGERFYYRHKLKVIDGTRCNDESLDVCVDGTCQAVGCDMMLGSNSTEDKCRKCSGDGTTCQAETGLLDTNYLLVGYNDVLLIPAGATNIEIKEKEPSNNYLAIRNLTGHYYLNGNWRIDFPRTMWFAGCYWHYERKPQGFAAPDHLKCLGPTTEPVILVLLQQDRNVGINYEYHIPESQNFSSPETYSWTLTQYGPCSVSCGGGFQTRNVTCNSRQSLDLVESKLCDINSKPSDTQQCNQDSCPPRWNEGDWSKCSESCGTNGTQERKVHCERVDAHGKTSKVADAVCASELGKKPITIQECNIGLVCPEWYLGPWLPCNKLCGEGVQTRTVKCYRKDNEQITILPDDECPDEKPETSKECLIRPCEGIDWITTAWSGCKACGQTKEARTAYCGTKQGKIYANSLCDASKKPQTVRECDGPPCEFQWYTSQWSKCSSQCNDGVQTRNVVCGAFDGNEIHKASTESKCDVQLKPNNTRDCEPKEDECIGEWFAGPWSTCSEKCGGGKKERTVVCFANGTSVKPTLCNQADILFSVIDCNTEKCSDDEILPVLGTRIDDEKESSEEEDDEYDDMEECDYSTDITDDTSDIIKVMPTDSFDFDETSHATESTLRDDELMLSDATGFELAPKSTSMPLSTDEGSGEDSEEGSGAAESSFGDDKLSSRGLDVTTDTEGSADSSIVTEEPIVKKQTTLWGSSISSDSDDSSTKDGATTGLDDISTTTESDLSTSESGSTTESDLSTSESGSTASGLDVTTESGSSVSTDDSSSSLSGSTTISGLSTDDTSVTTESGSSSSDSMSSTILAGSSTTESSSSIDDSTTTSGGLSTSDSSTTVDPGTGTTETDDDFIAITEQTIIPKGLDVQKSLKPNGTTSASNDDLTTEESGSSESSESDATTTSSGLSSSSESGSSSSDGSSLSTESVSSLSTESGSSLSTESGSSLSTESVSSLSTGSGSSLSTESSSSSSDETSETATTDSSTSDSTSESTSDLTTESTSDVTTESTSDVTTESTSDVTTDFTESSESSTTSDSSSTSDVTTASSDVTTLSTDDVTSTTDSATTPASSTSDDGASSISTGAKSTNEDGLTSTTDSSISTTIDPGITTDTTLDLPTDSSTTGDGSSTSVDGSSTTVDGSSTSVDGSSTSVDGSSTTVEGSTTGDGSSTTVDGVTTETSDRTSTSDISTDISTGASTDGSTTVDGSSTDGGSTTETPLDSSSLQSTGSDETTVSSGLTDLTTEGTSDSTTQGSTDVSSDGSTATTATTEEVSGTTDGASTSSIDDTSTASSISTESETTGSSTVEGSGSTTDIDSSSTLSTDDSSKSTDIEGSTESSTEGSSQSTDTEGSTQSTIEGSTVSTLSTEEDTTIDIWTTTDSSTDFSEFDDMTTPNTLITAIELESTTKRPKLCKRKKKTKKPSCTAAEFGCCPDGKTKAKGPFDEGCIVPKTCNETTYGCCSDGLSPAAGKNNKGCPPSICNQTLFGCCYDDFTIAEGPDFEGCPIETTTTEQPTEETDSTTDASGSTELTDTTETGDTAETETTWSTTSDDELSTESTTPPAMHCAQSTYGCCPDGISEATGENFHGCDIIDKDNCTNSYYGCCEDGKTSAVGANNAGCASCIQAQFGCCPDNLHPAHGPKMEGCCLNSQFGCCPDNILEAQGPQLEGCGCEYSSYGCCPDKITPARGYDNDGCGCEFSTHGCCSDQLTNAKGPKFEGCPCHTSQFGCCPDGVTVPQGPHGYGCHCTHSTHKCCGDGITPAQGPDAEGCSCANSQFGCCPDGLSDANGTSFEGCQNIPVSPQASCALPSEKGECSDYVVKYYYDANYGGCSRFWYGGCGGNNNRFDSQDDCEAICVKPEAKAVCDLPKVKGACDGYIPMYYYDTERKTCSQFIYSGCLGNNNRFTTREECLQLCSVDESIPTCEQPVDEGPCNGTFERWHFDKDSEECRPFNYGGCKGNKNNFGTEHACLYSCKKPGVLRDSCKLDKLEGECIDSEARWYFSESDNKCMPFYYTGCGGNKNNYASIEDCEQSCPKKIDLDLCHFPAEIGECQNYTTKWYFDTRESNCRQFYYGGCGGNKNNFEEETDCLNKCIVQPTTPPTPTEPFNVGHCALHEEVGPCNRYENRWAYSQEDGVCHQFVYGGCGGNQNNFESSNECELNCADSQNPCDLRPIQGPCDENITRWYFDNRVGSCQEFVYSGCGSNRNNFYTEQSCEQKCGRREEPHLGEHVKPHYEPTEPEHVKSHYETTEPHEPEQVVEYPTTKPVVEIKDRFDGSGDDYCNEPMDHGDDSCEDPRVSIAYYYDSRKQRCEAFAYSGCGGNGNRFDTLPQCDRQCGVSKGKDVCSEPSDIGPCDEWRIQYYYNTATKSCDPFYYGGCDGNGNRFDSIEECESICIAREEPISNKAICLLRPSSGRCNTTEDFSSKRYYYDDSRGTCMVFIYSGCAGNQNNFKTLESCLDFCSTGVQPPRVDPIPIEHQEPEPEEEQPCQVEQEYCHTLNCPYGISKEYNEKSCEICSCDDPCHNHVCPEDSRCSVDFVPDDQQTHDSPLFIAVCRQVRKPGECPVLSNSTRCERECYEDSDCRGDKKCCVAGCGFNCVPAVDERHDQSTEAPTTPSPYPVIPGGIASILETKPHNEINVNVSEGAVATLRCFATGYPYPTIHWKRGGLIINTAVGRYHLTSTGDLQIVQLHRTDSGSYVCVADNGLGPPVTREIELTVDKQERIPAYIIGDKNSTQIVTLNQPATLRCLAGGVPNVYISWWKGKNLIPYTDTISHRFEITKDYSLVFKRVDLSDLGTYLCEAYSGVGKPVSIQVTLKAIGPVHIKNPQDEIYRQYLIAVPEAPKPSYPYRPTSATPPRLPPREDQAKMPKFLATAHIRFLNGSKIEPNQQIMIECNVTGSPKAVVRWYKDERELDSSKRIRITEIDEMGSSLLTISNSTKDDTGFYKCEAINSHSKAYHTEHLIVEGIYVPASCIDNQFFANCGLIVEGNYCNHKYYSKFCCRSCTIAGQLSWSHPNNI